MPTKLTTEQFIERSKIIHKGAYDYSNVVYVASMSNVKIICKKHGEFMQKPGLHLSGSGCNSCGLERTAASRTTPTDKYMESIKKVHGDRYDYSETVFMRNSDKIIIICKKHGRFTQIAKHHKLGSGCAKCDFERRLSTQDEFLEKSKAIHGDTYDYSKSKYEHSEKKIDIICKKHGVFKQKPTSHIQGAGCHKCGNEKRGDNSRLTNEEFISKAKAIHGDRYDYSSAVYTKSDDKINIICKIHGEFQTTPTCHLSGSDCRKCANIIIGQASRLTTEEFIKRSIKIHGLKYDYSLTDYNDGKTKVKIICKKHGIFLQTPSAHYFFGIGCQKCKKLTNEEFIERAKKIHGDLYNYDKTEYVDSATKLTVTCKKHGDFAVLPGNHTLCKSGCPICFASKGENLIARLLENNKIKFIRQHWFKDCRIKLPLKFDFYLPEHNKCIEFDGLQHFVDNNWFGKSSFDHMQKSDKIKNEYCKNNNIPLLRIRFDEKKIENKIMDFI